MLPVTPIYPTSRTMLSLRNMNNAGKDIITLHDRQTGQAQQFETLAQAFSARKQLEKGITV